MENQELETVLVIETSDEHLRDGLLEILPNEGDLTLAKRAIGGFEITAFFTFTVAMVGKIFGFVSGNRDRISRGSIIIGKEKIEITNFKKEDALKLIESEPIQKMVAAYLQESQSDDDTE